MEFGNPAAPPQSGTDDHTMAGEPELHEKKPMMRKMKDKMKKIKDSMTKSHGHADDQVNDHTSEEYAASEEYADRESEGFDDAEDEGMDVDQQVHGAPKKVPSLVSAYESAANPPQHTARDVPVSPVTDSTGPPPYGSVPPTNNTTIPHTSPPVSPRRSDSTDTLPVVSDPHPTPTVNLRGHKSPATSPVTSDSPQPTPVGIPRDYESTDTSPISSDQQPTPTVNLRGHKSPATSPVTSDNPPPTPVGIPRDNESTDSSPIISDPQPTPAVNLRGHKSPAPSPVTSNAQHTSPAGIPSGDNSTDLASAPLGDIPCPAPVVIPRGNESSDTSSAPFDTPFPAPVLVPHGNDTTDTSPMNLDTVEETNPHTEPAVPDTSTHTTDAESDNYPTSYGPPGGSNTNESPELLSSFQAMAISEQREGQPDDQQLSRELPEEHVASDVEKKPATYTEKLTSTAVAAKDAAVSAASTVYSKVVETVSSPRGTVSSPKGTVSSPRSPMTTPGYGLVEKKPGYTEKLSGTAWAAKDAAVSAASTVYAKVAGSPKSVDSSVTHDDVAREVTPSTGSPTKQEKGSSVREYLSEKLSPGEDDKALCEVISGSMKKRGDEEVEEVVEKGRIKLPVATGGEEDEQFASKDDTTGLGAGTGAGGEKGMLEKIKEAVGPLVGTGGTKPADSDSAGVAGAGAGPGPRESANEDY